jgi:general secretion pathway protein F
MPTFAYTARDSGGRAQRGALEAASRRDALRIISARGLRPVDVSEQNGAPSSAAPGRAPAPSLPRGPQQWSRKQRLPFLIALSRLVSGGLSAGEAVRLLATRLNEPRLRLLAAALWDRLSQGQTLSRALEDFPQVFDGQTVNLIAAGEATGSLREVLQRLIEHFTEQRELRSRMIAAMAYPVFVVLLAIGVILFFLFFLLPRLQTLLDSLGGRLPPATQLLVSISDFLLRYGAFIAGAIVLGSISWWRWRKTNAGRAATDAMLLRLPVTRSFAVRTTVLNFSHTLAILLENGITTAEALRLAERTVENTRLREELRAATDRVLEGESLSASLARTKLFPLLVLDQLAVAEQTGNLAPGLRAIAQDYQAGVSRWLQSFTRIVSTVVLVFAFSFVAFLAYAIVTAVLQVSSSFKF